VIWRADRCQQVVQLELVAFGLAEIRNGIAGIRERVVVEDVAAVAAGKYVAVVATG
jgi:hypothetical protein